MRKWNELQVIFEELLGSDHVYFQPPEGYKIEYPAIIYNVAKEDFVFAGNNVQRINTRYEVKVIYKNPAEDMLTKMASLRFCSPDRSYRANGLYHDVYNVYF